jgi:hypothetical protein
MDLVPDISRTIYTRVSSIECPRKHRCIIPRDLCSSMVDRQCEAKSNTNNLDFAV